MSQKFKLYDDPNEVDEEGREETDEADQNPEVKHPKLPLSILEYRLGRFDDYYKCQLFRKSWSCGKGFLKDDDAADNPEYIELPTAASCGRALDGDTVVVELKELLDPSDESEEDYQNCIGRGRVVGILRRKFEDIYDERFICRVAENNCVQMIPLDGSPFKFRIASPFDRLLLKGKVYQYSRKAKSDYVEINMVKEIDVEKQKTDDGLTGSQLFSVRYVCWSKYHWYPKGYVETSFNALNVTRYMIGFQIPGKHSLANQYEARKLLETTLPQLKNDPTREDLTDLYVFTIDDENAKCLDDALSIERCKEHYDCWKVGVHITDIGSILPEDTELDDDAKKRLLSAEGLISANEKDFDDTNGKMLPHEFTKACSLTKGENHLAMTTFFHSASPPKCIYTDSTVRNGCIERYPPALTVINPKRRLSYKAAQDLICERKTATFDQPSDRNLPQQLYHLWNVMWQFRLNRLGQAAYFIHNLGFNEGDYLPDQVMAKILVKEAMITNNAFTAFYLDDKEIPFLARSLPFPTLDKMSSVSLVAQSPFQKAFYDIYKSLRPDYKEELKEIDPAATMFVSRQVYRKVRDFLSRENVEVAVFLACCDRLHPQLGVSYSEFRRVQQRHRIKYINLEEYANGKLVVSDLSHFHLRVNIYAQCSSPLRRYADLDTQRRLIRYLTDDVQPYIDREISQKLCEKEEELEKFNQIFNIHKIYARDTSRTDVVEGFVLNFSEFRLDIFVPNFSLMENFSFRLYELGPTKVTADSLLWKMRYYDCKTQDKGALLGQIKACDYALRNMRSAVEVFPWNQFLTVLKRDEFSKINHLKRCMERVQVIEIKEKEEEEIYKITGCLTTSNGIFHGREVEITMGAMKKNQTFGTSLHFQFGLGLDQGIQAVVPQFMFLNRVEAEGAVGLEICMLHRRQWLTVFEMDCEEMCVPPEKFPGLVMHKYYKHWLPLVMMDGVYSSLHDCNSITLQLKEINLAEGFFSLQRAFCEYCFLNIKRKDFLCMRKKNSNDKDNPGVSAAHGVIIKDNNSDEKDPLFRYHFKVFSTLGKEFFEENEKDLYSCEIVPLSISHRRMVNALDQLYQASPLVQTICVGDQESISSLSSPSSAHRSNAVRRIFSSGHVRRLGQFPHPLNAEQLSQIERALQSDFTLIQGPPGTGKSYMGAHLAYYFKQLNMKLSKNGKILYCGPSNKSVDVVAEYLQHAPNIKFVRVYGGIIEELDYPVPIKPRLAEQETLGRVPKSLEAYALHHVIRKTRLLSAKQLKKFDNKARAARAFQHVDDAGADKFITLEEYKAYKSTLKAAKTQYLKQMDVILCTCSVAGGELLSQSEEFQFSQCIIDECGMCSEPETLIPIMTATNKTPNPQIVLIGDHKQLEPVITCLAAAKGGLKKSMFERLHKHADTLTLQYRMHPTICDFPSEEFYEDQLKTDVSVLNRDGGDNKLLQLKGGPALFCNVEGAEKEDDSKSKFNEHQVEVVVKVLNYLLIKKQVSPSSVMVLSPYLAQCKKIKEAVEKLTQTVQYGRKINLDSLHIGSVATSQGSEADYVILSTVRSSACSDSDLSFDLLWLYKRIGFVTDDHQINVAITRAKLGLVIIGNKRLLQHYEKWKRLIHSYSRRNAVKEERELDSLFHFNFSLL